ncbi:unnamed protein product [Prunus armeniaca]|uniref:Uncharacterized protein n=1 Tax=Prunus armeniaca TaxID=36596 RepID=A0A6J5XX56_PRUAR|nr:unnamed protein product [Prunus armeniaca]
MAIQGCTSPYQGGTYLGAPIPRERWLQQATLARLEEKFSAQPHRYGCSVIAKHNNNFEDNRPLKTPNLVDFYKPGIELKVSYSGTMTNFVGLPIFPNA